MRTAVANVRVFDGQRLREPGTVVIDGAVIGDDASGARVVDGQGGVLLPGLIDAHVHLADRATLEVFADYGVTTALDMGTWPISAADALRRQPGLTDIRTSGVGATSPASRHGQRPGRPPEGGISTPEQAKPYVADRVADGVDYIKIIIDLPGFDQATVNALVAAAHEQGKQVITHASSFDAWAMAQAAGTDVVTHAPLDRPLDAAAVAAMVAGHRVSVPTLAMMEGIVANTGGKGPRYGPARDSVRQLYRAGVPILAGTDANHAPGVPASPPFGDSLHHELELLVDAGLTTTDALRAATSLNAEHFRLTDRGAIEPGKRADLMLIDGDPVADIRATRQIRRVWLAGAERKPPTPGKWRAGGLSAAGGTAQQAARVA